MVWLAVLAVMLPGMGIAGAAVVYANPVTEQLVEGHTVFAVIEVINTEDDVTEEFAAAVAVLVRENQDKKVANRFPGVLWFNDQYLTNPTSDTDDVSTYRHPCSGAVLATNAGAPQPPRDLAGLASYTALTYVESYLITDPNDHMWNVDKWDFAGDLVWTVALRGNDPTYSIEDDGTTNCAPFTDNRCSPYLQGTGINTDQNSSRAMDCRTSPIAGNNVPFAPANQSIPVQVGQYAKNPGDNGEGYPCTGCSTLQYNAVLYFLLADLTVPGTLKNHTELSADWNDDVSGCQAGTSQWPCPAGGDNMEGNSHPYNPENDFPMKRYSGEGNHGGSADCNLTGTGAYDDYDCHATADIDLYYGVAAAPPTRNYRVTDLEGSSAAYHCHDGVICGPDPYAGNTSS